MKWMVGVTTVPQRVESLLPRTLQSLTVSGFVGEAAPRLFVDGVDPHGVLVYRNRWPHLNVTARWPRIRPYANWMLSLAELYARNPAASRYAIFQDDVLVVKGLREYLERSQMPKRGYQNLHTAVAAEASIPSKDHQGWFKAPACLGKGALGLVFNQETVRTILSHKELVDWPMDVHRGHVGIDWSLVRSLTKLGWEEWVHMPSLTQHTGRDTTTIPVKRHPRQPLAPSWKGEEWDALSLLK